MSNSLPQTVYQGTTDRRSYLINSSSSATEIFPSTMQQTKLESDLKLLEGHPESLKMMNFSLKIML